jgi:hypothetical protein
VLKQRQKQLAMGQAPGFSLERKQFSRRDIDTILRYADGDEALVGAALIYTDASLEELRALVDRHQVAQVLGPGTRRRIQEALLARRPADKALARQLGLNLPALLAEYQRQELDPTWTPEQDEKLVQDAWNGRHLATAEHSERAGGSRLRGLCEDGFETGLFDDVLLDETMRQTVLGQVEWPAVNDAFSAFGQIFGAVRGDAQARFEALRRLRPGKRPDSLLADSVDKVLIAKRTAPVRDFMALSERLQLSPVWVTARYFDLCLLKPAKWSKRELEWLRECLPLHTRNGRVNWSLLAEVRFGYLRSPEACRGAYLRYIVQPQARPQRRVQVERSGNRNRKRVTPESEREPKERTRTQLKWKLSEDVRLWRIYAENGRTRAALRSLDRTEFQNRSLGAIEQHHAGLRKASRQQEEEVREWDQQILDRIIAAGDEDAIDWPAMGEALDVRTTAVMGRYFGVLRQAGVEVWSQQIGDYVEEQRENGDYPWWLPLIAEDQGEAREAFDRARRRAGRPGCDHSDSDSKFEGTPT